MTGEPILIDTNVLVDLSVGVEELRIDAEKLRRKHPVWVTSPLCRYEFGNVLSTYVRRKLVSKGDGLLILKQGLNMVRFCHECDEAVIFAEAYASALSFYDATYAACARQLNIQLYTRDKKLLKNCPEIAHAISDA
jgi:predicted nucleic acid-binding protein